MSDLSPFLHPTEPKTSDDSAEMSRLNAELANKFSPSYFEINNDVTLTDEELDDLRNLAASDAAQLINYLDPLLREKQDSLNRQVEAIESIASQARNLAQSTAREANILKEHKHRSHRCAYNNRIIKAIPLITNATTASIPASRLFW